MTKIPKEKIFHPRILHSANFKSIATMKRRHFQVHGASKNLFLMHHFHEATREGAPQKQKQKLRQNTKKRKIARPGIKGPIITGENSQNDGKGRTRTVSVEDQEGNPSRTQ